MSGSEQLVDPIVYVYDLVPPELRESTPSPRARGEHVWLNVDGLDVKHHRATGWVPSTVQLPAPQGGTHIAFYVFSVLSPVVLLWGYLEVFATHF